MKYNELIQFDPIEEVIKFEKLDNEDYRANLIKNFVCSQKYEDYVIPQICSSLDLNATTETKGIQIVGNYGTGKSHLMSFFSIIAENEEYLPLVQSVKAKDWLKTIAGKYMVYRFELGNQQELWDIVTYKIDQALEQWGVDYSISADNTPASYSEKLAKMMAAFEEKYPDRGFMLVIDEMLAYLKGRSEPAKLNSDLPVLQALGQMSDRTHFRMVFGVQELIYRATEFQFAKDMLDHVAERFVDLTIQKEDVQFIVQKRLLQKDEHQKAKIREHLSHFVSMFPHMSNNLDTYVNLFPVHPSYFENFSLIRIGKSQREVLRTLSSKFNAIKDDDVPTNEPGLICYDSYWKDMTSTQSLKSDPDVSKVSDIVDLVDQKIEDNFTRGLAPKKKLAHRIVAAAAIKMLQADLRHQNGVTADSLANDLCYVDPTCDNYDELVDLAFNRTLDSIVSATIGQYFEKGDHEYHLRIEGGVNYEQKVKDYAAQMSSSQKDAYFYKFLTEIFMLGEKTYRETFKIWEHTVEWQSHKCMRAGYIFMGNPNERSTTQPQQHFYIYLMPIFDEKAKAHQYEKDSVFFLMDALDDDFKDVVSLFGSADAQEGNASSDEKPNFHQLRDKYFKAARNSFNNQFLQKTMVEYMGDAHPMIGMPGSQADTLIDAVDNVISYIMEEQFEQENPCYPKFTALTQPLTDSNRDNLLRSAKQKIVTPTTPNRNGEAILMGLGLWQDGRLNTAHSQYARSLKQKLDDKGGKVLNRDEILKVFWAPKNQYISSDFLIEADLEMLVMTAMANLGEIEIVLSGGTRINASTIAQVNALTPQDNYTFSNICPPKGLNIALIREIMLGILGSDRTAELEDPNTSVFADLSTQAQRLEGKVVRLQHDIQGGYRFNGDIEIIPEVEARELSTKLDRLRGFCNQMQRYNTKAKMRNIDWQMDVVRTAMTDTKQRMEDTTTMLKELGEFRNIISYLRTAMTNISDADLRQTINDEIEKISVEVKKSKAERDKYKATLESMQNRYADWYMKQYLSAHISNIENQRSLQPIVTSDTKRICDIVCDAPFIISMSYNEWRKKLDAFKVADPTVTKEAILAAPTSRDGFNPVTHQAVLPKFSDLKDELQTIYNEYNRQFHDALEDPTTKRNQEMLNNAEKIMLKQFADGSVKLDVQYARTLIEIISKLQRSFTKVEMSSSDMANIFSRPMTKQQALDALAQYIDQQSYGKKPEDVRIILKLDK